MKSRKNNPTQNRSVIQVFQSASGATTDAYDQAWIKLRVDQTTPAGMGFAALESTGYAFTSFLLSGGSVSATVAITLLRGILAPFGHGTRTAILASVLFRESKGVRFRLNGNVILAFSGVALLHALWDGLPPILAFLFGSGLDVFIAQMIIGGIGFFILWRRWHTAKQAQMEQLSTLEMATALRI